MSIVEDVVKVRTPQPRFPVLKTIAKRFSPRIFGTDSIPEDHIRSIFEAARWTPSGRNNQPWFFYSVKKGTASYEKIKLCIPNRNGWALSAPLIIIAYYSPTEPQGTLNKWAQYDLGAAVISLILQAQELGYYSRQIGSFDLEETKKQFPIETPYIPLTLIAMGKIGTEKEYSEYEKTYTEKDLTPTGRKDIVYKELA